MDSLKDSFKDAVKEASAKKVVLELAAGYKNIKGKEVTIMQGSGLRMLKFKTSGLLRTTIEYEVVGSDWQESAKRSAGKATAGGYYRRRSYRWCRPGSWGGNRRTSEG